MPPTRRRGPIVFMAVWLVLWTAGILIVLWLAGAKVLAGDLGGAALFCIWLAFAGFGLYAGLRRMQTLLGLARPPAQPARPPKARWSDDLPDRHDP